MSSSSSRTAPISTGRGRACSNTCSRLPGRLPADVHPSIGPDATGAGWVYEYALVDRSHKHSLADLRSLQDWYLRYQLETVPGVAEVATIGGFVRQYQVNLDPQKLLAYGIPLSTVIDRVRAQHQRSRRARAGAGRRRVHDSRAWAICACR